MSFGVVPDAEPVREQPSLFTHLLEDAKKAVAKPNFLVTIDDVRPGYALAFSGELAKPVLERWQDACRKGPRGSAQYDEINSLKLAKIMISNLCTGIRVKGETILDANGVPVTFQNPEFQIALGFPDNGAECVGAFLGRDPMVEAVGIAVLKGTGYAVTADADPLES